MSFTKTISTIAALLSIFGTSVLAWNLVNKQPEPPKQTEELEHKVAELEQRLAAEEQGYGLTSLKRHAENLGLPLPSYSMEGDSLVLTIYRSKAAATAVLSQDIIESLSKSERAGWEWLVTRETASSSDYATAMALPKRTALNHLKRFTTLNLLQKSGSGPSTLYQVIRP